MKQFKVFYVFISLVISLSFLVTAEEETKLAMNKKSTAPVIDGTITVDEWGAYIFSVEPGAKFSITQGDVKDFFTQVYATFDDNNLYVAASVKIPDNVNDGEGGDIWNGDGLQLTVTPSIPYDDITDCSELNFALSTDGTKVKAYRWKPTAEEYTEGTIIIKRTDGYTIYEAQIPWNSVVDGVAPKVGSTIGLGFNFTLCRENNYIAIEYNAVGETFSKFNGYTAANPIVLKDAVQTQTDSHLIDSTVTQHVNSTDIKNPVTGDMDILPLIIITIISATFLIVFPKKFNYSN